MTQVTLEHITKSFGSVHVIKDVSIEIDDGEFVALVGPSGSGKSTILRMIAGLEDPTGGIVRIGERVVNDLMPKDRDIAMVFQSYALYPHMSVRENMSFSLELAGRPKAERDAAVAEAAEILGLSDLLDRKPKALSGGQRQRVAMGRAIVRKPEVFLFDEPLSNLDAKLRTAMRKEVKLLHQRLTSTSIYVTHDQTEAMTMADKIVVLNNGMVEQIGSPTELYSAPDNLFVAGFIGTPQMNFIEGIVSEDGTVTPDGNAGLPGLQVDPGLPLAAGDAVVVGIRPERIEFVPDGPYSANVELVEPMGSEALVTCTFGPYELRVQDRSMETVAQGADVHFIYDPALALVFARDSGKRVARAG
ncbi:ABC transporter ATP-binding protein [Tropicimonas sp. IMCC6043]|uniref:ABC transporter ATP-binding protein n=1 Tax=Tropicimonas sp. IMCC6043 TaxID=2510645 RepID=UPI00101C726F|nr:sn-glycerol-3-phosphate ABC transporter ATP-binding protein UgpC [Tropicimonas sp. IMCC6043]RYH06201.1 sn-glycerol-3-phosphate ABC transporter ATP-binding protein UgpC [Tropicimonas sp. IMCC6043]